MSVLQPSQLTVYEGDTLTDDVRREFKQRAIDAASTITDEESSDCDRTILHSFTTGGMNLGADWDIDGVLKYINEATQLAWRRDDMFGHQMWVNTDDRILRFDVKAPEPPPSDVLQPSPDLRDELAAAILATKVAGWRLPVRYEQSTQPGYRDSWDLIEADGIRIAIVGCEPDARIIAVALNWVLTTPVAARDEELAALREENERLRADHERLLDKIKWLGHLGTISQEVAASLLGTVWVQP